MRIGLMRHWIELWDSEITLNEYGVEQVVKKLLYRCPAAVDELDPKLLGDTTQSINHTLRFMVRFQRTLQNPTSSMYVVFGGVEYDIVTPCKDRWQLNKYLTFHGVRRGK